MPRYATQAKTGATGGNHNALRLEVSTGSPFEARVCRIGVDESAVFNWSSRSVPALDAVAETNEFCETDLGFPSKHVTVEVGRIATGNLPIHRARTSLEALGYAPYPSFMFVVGPGGAVMVNEITAGANRCVFIEFYLAPAELAA